MSELSPEASAAPSSKRRRWLAILAGFALTILYLIGGVFAAGAGVGWYYLDANDGYDLAKVREISAGAEVVDTQGRLIGRIGATDRKMIERDDISPEFIAALLASEDQRFFYHPGFDPVGTMRAAWANYRAESIQEGGSTLTQQLARDVYGLEGRHIERKLNEIALAVWIEREYSKDEILVHYLNRIYFGSGFYGVGAAAKGYFGKELEQLEVDEAAMICGLIRSPSRFSPFVSRERAIAARDQTLRRMNANGQLSSDEMESFLEAPTPVANDRDERIHRGQASFLLSRIEKEVRQIIGDRSLEGLKVRSSVDLELQQKAAFEIDQHLTSLQEGQPEEAGVRELEGAAVVIENKTGRILLTVGSRDFLGSEYDRSLDMKRPSGSAFFPFVYAAAFEQENFDASSPVVDAPFDNREMGLGGTSGVLGEWSTENPENRWEGSITAGEALRLSKNSPTARLGLQIGLQEVSRLSKAVGIESDLRPLSGSLLGASEMNLSELTRAYSVFPNRGKPSPRLHLIDSISAEGEELKIRTEEVDPEEVISPRNAELIAGLIDRGKSGTTPAYTDAWHFGFNERFTWGVWVGKDSFETIFPMAFGGTVARPVADAIIAESDLADTGSVEKKGMGKPSREFEPAMMRRRASVVPVVPALIGPDPYATLGMK
ncbi:MAG: transglycosylase domain-containing protein [Verrucomicrobiales bacterium]|nr:transglycosylase domain-containing protein [Verrucomicrobiales bacterium]